MEQEIRELKSKIEGLEAGMNTIIERLDKTEKANKEFLQAIQQIAMKGEFNNSILAIGNRIAATNRLPGVTPGGAIKPSVKSELVDVKEEIQEPVPADKSQEVTPVDDNITEETESLKITTNETDPIEEFYVKYYIDSKLFKPYLASIKSDITFRKLLATNYIDEFIKITAKDARQLKKEDFLATNMDEYIPRTIYRYGKQSSEGITDAPNAKKLFDFIVKQYNSMVQ